MSRHNPLYFNDGTLTLKVTYFLFMYPKSKVFQAGDGTLYNVYRELLITHSDCFNGMLTLPDPNHPPVPFEGSSKEWIEKGREANLDGFSDEKAVQLPPQFTAMECQKFLEFIFNSKG